MKSYRELTVDIIDKFYSTRHNLKTLLNLQFSRYNVPSSERNRILVQTRDILRWKSRIDWYLRKNINSNFTKMQTMLVALLELGAYEIIFDERIPNYATINSIVELTKIKLNRKTSGLVNAVLRKISEEDFNNKPIDINDADWFSFPEWLYSKWVEQFGKKRTIQLMEYFNVASPLTIRINNKKLNTQIFVKNIPKDVVVEQIENSAQFFNVLSGGSALMSSESFNNGEFSFQDRASGMVVEVLDPQPNELILDVCAAPGTKTNYISELMKNTGNICASDVNQERIELAKQDSIRLGNSNIIFEHKDAIKAEFPVADRILIDAPCTGTGTIGRRPDIKWRRTSVQLEKITKLQQEILNHTSKFIKPGGILVYATCSLESEENWEVVEAFLKLHNDFKVISIENPQLKNYIDKKGALNTFPPDHKMDGMFAVKMMKNEK